MNLQDTLKYKPETHSYRDSGLHRIDLVRGDQVRKIVVKVSKHGNVRMYYKGTKNFEDIVLHDKVKNDSLIPEGFFHMDQNWIDLFNQAPVETISV